MGVGTAILGALCPGGTPIDGVEVDQDWSRGRTVLTMRDGSRIVVEGDEVWLEPARSVEGLEAEAARLRRMLRREGDLLEQAERDRTVARYERSRALDDVRDLEEEHARDRAKLLAEIERLRGGK